MELWKLLFLIVMKALFQQDNQSTSLQAKSPELFISLNIILKLHIYTLSTLLY